MARGRVSLADLVETVGEKSPVDGDTGTDGLFRANVPLDRLAPNPRNPRDSVGSLDDLASIKDRQLQPATAISRAAHLRLWPDDEPQLGDAKYVVVMGNRRLAAAHEYGRPGLDIVIRDSLASTSAEVIRTAVIENIGRRDLDVIEEARAVQLLVEETGKSADAAALLGKTKGWVSQRLALLKLDPQIQQSLRAGEYAVREARALANVPREAQVKAWRAALDKKQDPNPTESKQDRGVPSVDTITKSVTKCYAAGPKAFAEAARAALDESELRALVAALQLELSGE